MGPGAACAPFPASLSSSTSGFGTCHTWAAKRDNKPGFFSGFFFSPLRRNWLIKKPVWEKHMKILRQAF